MQGLSYPSSVNLHNRERFLSCQQSEKDKKGPLLNARSAASHHNCFRGSYKVQICVHGGYEGRAFFRRGDRWPTSRLTFPYLALPSPGELLCAEWGLPAKSAHLAQKTLSPPAVRPRWSSPLLRCADEGSPAAPADAGGRGWAKLHKRSWSSKSEHFAHIWLCCV